MDLSDGSDAEGGIGDFGDVDQDEENVLLGSDDEEFCRIQTGANGAVEVNEDKVLETDEEEEDVLDLALDPDDELDEFVEEPLKGGRVAPVKVRIQESNEQHNSQTQAEYVNESIAEAQSAGGDNDDEEDVETDPKNPRSRFLTERKTEEITSASIGNPIQILGERKVRSGHSDLRQPKNWGGQRPQLSRQFNRGPRLPPNRQSLLGDAPRQQGFRPRFPNSNEAPVVQFQERIFTDFNKPLPPGQQISTIGMVAPSNNPIIGNTPRGPPQGNGPRHTTQSGNRHGQFNRNPFRVENNQGGRPRMPNTAPRLPHHHHQHPHPHWKHRQPPPSTGAGMPPNVSGVHPAVIVNGNPGSPFQGPPPHVNNQNPHNGPPGQGPPHHLLNHGHPPHGPNAPGAGIHRSPPGVMHNSPQNQNMHGSSQGIIVHTPPQGPNMHGPHNLNAPGPPGPIIHGPPIGPPQGPNIHIIPQGNGPLQNTNVHGPPQGQPPNIPGPRQPPNSHPPNHLPGNFHANQNFGPVSGNFNPGPPNRFDGPCPNNQDNSPRPIQGEPHHPNFGASPRPMHQQMNIRPPFMSHHQHQRFGSPNRPPIHHQMDVGDGGPFFHQPPGPSNQHSVHMQEPQQQPFWNSPHGPPGDVNSWNHNQQEHYPRNHIPQHHINPFRPPEPSMEQYQHPNNPVSEHQPQHHFGQRQYQGQSPSQPAYGDGPQGPMYEEQQPDPYYSSADQHNFKQYGGSIINTGNPNMGENSDSRYDGRSGLTRTIVVSNMQEKEQYLSSQHREEDTSDYYRSRPTLKRKGDANPVDDFIPFSSPGKRLNNRLGPPVSRREGEEHREQVVQIILETKREMGLDDDYIKKLEDQKRLRAEILRKKEERRKQSKGGHDAEDGYEREYAESDQRQVSHTSIKPSRTSDTASSVTAPIRNSIYVNPKAFKGNLSLLNTNLKKINMATTKAKGRTDENETVIDPTCTKPKTILRIIRNKKGKIISQRKVKVIPNEHQDGPSSSKTS